MYYKIAILGVNLTPLIYSSNSVLKPFSIVLVPVKNKIVRGVVLSDSEKFGLKTLEILSQTDEYFTQIQVNLAKFCAQYYVCEIGVAFGLFTPNLSDKPVENLLSNKALNEDLIQQTKNDTRNCDEIFKSPKLNETQQKAFDFCEQNQSALIFGDTGCGKSEIYISIITKCLNAGRQALFLMPEISLTPQMERRLREYFGENLAIWHSKISPTKKAQILADFYDKKIKLIAGARSALFLPFENLGLIIVDEEHDDSYKSSENPRYNAHDLALFIAKKMNIQIVLGSATPLLTSMQKHPHFRIKGTFFKSEKEFIFDKNTTQISPVIRTELKKCIENHHQAIIFLPTRANFKYVTCANCGELIKCPYCAVAMSLHADKNMLKCHYCSHTQFFGASCAKCGKNEWAHRKIGTNELISQFKSEFKDVKFAKFDRDEITTQKKLEKALRDFNDGAIDVLIGTQMLSKGHDYHNVRLCVIMGLDDMLGYADFMARERTLALAIQLSGRAGRMGLGHVIIQSMQSEFFRAYVENYDGFLRDEMIFRARLYPPFARLMRILISDKSDERAYKIMNECVNRLKMAQKTLNSHFSAENEPKISQNSDEIRADVVAKNSVDFNLAGVKNGGLDEAIKIKIRADLLKEFDAKEPKFEIIGYGKAQIEYIASKFRYQILLRANDWRFLNFVAKKCDLSKVQIDPDPINFT